MKEQAIPHIRILDYEKAREFYVDALGFEIAFEWRDGPGFPVYMGIRRGDLYARELQHPSYQPVRYSYILPIIFNLIVDEGFCPFFPLLTS